MEDPWEESRHHRTTAMAVPLVLPCRRRKRGHLIGHRQRNIPGHMGRRRHLTQAMVHLRRAMDRHHTGTCRHLEGLRHHRVMGRRSTDHPHRIMATVRRQGQWGHHRHTMVRRCLGHRTWEVHLGHHRCPDTVHRLHMGMACHRQGSGPWVRLDRRMDHQGRRSCRSEWGPAVLSGESNHSTPGMALASSIAPRPDHATAVTSSFTRRKSEALMWAMKSPSVWNQTRTACRRRETSLGLMGVRLAHRPRT
mmetsp:Transcript_45101/g.89377  ORF Transcript_45101/g.89377 Transcript_45101/m.89377 type:complete len:250 (-) Transcript_45101:529-1278(-)